MQLLSLTVKFPKVIIFINTVYALVQSIHSIAGQEQSPGTFPYLLRIFTRYGRGTTALLQLGSGGAMGLTKQAAFAFVLRQVTLSQGLERSPCLIQWALQSKQNGNRGSRSLPESWVCVSLWSQAAFHSKRQRGQEAAPWLQFCYHRFHAILLPNFLVNLINSRKIGAACLYKPKASQAEPVRLRSIFNLD